MESEILLKLTRIEQILLEQNLFKKEFLNAEEASVYLGIKKSTLYKFTMMRKIAYFCPEGKLIFFRRIDLDEFIMRNRQESKEEIELEYEIYFREKGEINSLHLFTNENEACDWILKSLLNDKYA